MFEISESGKGIFIWESQNQREVLLVLRFWYFKIRYMTIVGENGDQAECKLFQIQICSVTLV